MKINKVLIIIVLVLSVITIINMNCIANLLEDVEILEVQVSELAKDSIFSNKAITEIYEYITSPVLITEERLNEVLIQFYNYLIGG